MIHLFPANGICAIAYQELINFLQPNPVESFSYPALAQPTPAIPSPLHWEYFSDIINHQYAGKSDNIGIGHSLGGTLILYDALKNPNRWKTIFIIEPALFSPWINATYKWIRRLKLENQLHPMVRITRSRRSYFESKKDTFNRWRQRSAFCYMSDAALNNFIDASLLENETNYTLRFPKDWECEIYKNMCSLDPFIWRELPTLKPKLIVIAGNTSNTFFESAKKRLRPYVVDLITIPNTTHLLPFETPLALSRIILKHS